MPKVLSQAGNSLADTYDVEGSIAGIENIETRDLPIVHEMGGTVFSERWSTTVRRAATGNIAASAVIGIVLTDLPNTPTRILGISAISDDASRLAALAVLARDPIAGREFPLWIHETATADNVRMVDDGSAVTQFDLLRPRTAHTINPSFTGGFEQPQIVNEIAIRGAATAFGAGTVFVRVFIYIAFAETGRVPSSRGLPIPSW